MRTRFSGSPSPEESASPRNSEETHNIPLSHEHTIPRRGGLQGGCSLGGLMPNISIVASVLSVLSGVSPFRDVHGSSRD